MGQGLYSSPLKQIGGAVAQGVGGLMSVAGGIIGSGKRRAEQKSAEAEMQRNKARYTNLDTSNLAANLDKFIVTIVTSASNAISSSCN